VSSDESADGVVDLVKQGAGNAITVHEVRAAGEEEGFGKDHAVAGRCANGIPLADDLFDMGVNLVPAGQGKVRAANPCAEHAGGSLVGGYSSPQSR
jgi:hypothetical protein